MSISVCALRLTPIKGTRLNSVDRIELDGGGARGNRAFYLIDERGRMQNGKQLGDLQAVVSELDGDRLRLRFPDGRIAEDVVRDDGAVQTEFFSQSREDRLVAGPWAEPLSEYLGQAVRLVRVTGPAGAVDRGGDGGVSLISRASLSAIAAEASVEAVDARRFRMLIEVDGVGAHAEDEWVGRQVRVGSATVRFRGHVGRCLVTSREPETGAIDLPTLDILAAYRGNVESTEPLAFGIYGEVVEPGAVAVGDAVTLVA